jgi:multidrug efflux system membrane fusion protein
MPSPANQSLPRGLARGFLILSVMFLAACGHGGGAPQGGMPPPPQVNVAQVVQKEVSQWDEFTGRIEAVDKVEIRPRVTGYLDKVGFVEGSEVKKGDVLFEIDEREYRSTLQRANADIERAKARIALAQKQLDRGKSLLNGNAMSRNDVDQRESELDQARADLSGMQAVAAQARLNLEFTRITAPISGRVGKALVTPGNLVTGGMPVATLLTTVVSMDPVYVDFEGDENTYLRYQGLASTGERQSSRDAQNPVKVGLANEDGYPHDGHMVFVDNALDPATGTIRARAVMENPTHLFTPGLFARVRLLGSGAHSALLIHDRAVMTDQDRKFVFVLGPENKALRRDVKLGPAVEGLRSVTDGLKPEDVVLVNGIQKVFFPGMPVQPNTVPMDDPERQPPPAPGAPQQGAAGAAH